MADVVSSGAGTPAPLNADPVVATGELLVRGADRATAMAHATRSGLASVELLVGSLSMEVDAKQAKFAKDQRFARGVALFEILLGVAAIAVALVFLSVGFTSDNPNPRRSPIVVLAMGAIAVYAGGRGLQKSRESFEAHMKPFLHSLRRVQD